MNNSLADFYKCPEHLVNLSSSTEQSEVDTLALFQGDALSASARWAAFGESAPRLPLDASRIVDNLRLERYTKRWSSTTSSLLASEAARRLYYQIRPALPDSLRRTLQRIFLGDWDRLPFPQWPVDTSVEEIFEKLLLLAMKIGGLESVPFIWFWPDGAASAVIMTHDVEGPAGLAFLPSLIDIDDEFAIKTSFQLVPEKRYAVSKGLLDLIRKRGCEVNVHGLDHDGNLFGDRKAFLRQCKRINHYVQEFGAEGFRSACMYRNVDWYEELHIRYDMSVPNVAHLEPQRGGCCTVFPYFIGQILELPLTTVQDYSLFHILRDYSLELWKKQVDLILERHGLISFIAHPDYLLNKRSRDVYKNLLGYLSDLQGDKKVWIPRPAEINRWWRQRHAMKLVFEDGKWNICGEGQERARIGLAHIHGDRIVFSLEQNSEAPAKRASA
jgi:hypothetical protein